MPRRDVRLCRRLCRWQRICADDHLWSMASRDIRVRAQSCPSFGLGGDEYEDNEPEKTGVQSPVTPATSEFIKDALDAGFTLDQLSRTERVLDSGKSPLSGDLHLPKSIITTLAQKKLAEAPWQGPLPAPRVSPPRTLGDCLVKASHWTLGSQGRSGTSFRQPTSPTRPSLAS